MNYGDGSSNGRVLTRRVSERYGHVFFDTANPVDLAAYPGPVVLTVNPGAMADTRFYRLSGYPMNLMMVRAQANTWNLSAVDDIVDLYTSDDIPVVLTFLAYPKKWRCIPEDHHSNYTEWKRMSNPYMAITTDAWRAVMSRYRDNILVSSCGKIEGERGSGKCRYCGVCLREYFATSERMRAGEG